MWVLGLAADGKWYILECIRDRLNLTARTDALFYLHRKWKPKKTGYEEYGMQADIEHIEYVQKIELYRFPIIPLGGQMSKPNRIRRLVPYFEAGKFIFPPTMAYRDSTGRVVDLVNTFLTEEFEAFPVLSHDDMLDALARVVEPEMKIDLPSENMALTARGFDLTAALSEHSFTNSGMSGAADSDDWMLA